MAAVSSERIISGLSGFAGRGAGSDSERRAARWLAGELRAGGDRVRIETFWCRPNWALAHAWHVALGLAGSLLAVGSPRPGGIVILIALLCIIADGLLGRSPGRRLTPESASQNLIVHSRQDESAGVSLLVTANIDAGRAGLVHRQTLRRAAASLRRLSRGLTPGYGGWLVILLAWMLVAALLRARGAHGTGIGVVQLLPTVTLVLALALLLDQGTAAPSPGAGDNASGTAAAVALTRALSAGPPQNLDVTLLLQGAGDGEAIGLRRHLSRHRTDLRRQNTIVLGFGPSGGGRPRWLHQDGQLAPLRSFAVLERLAASAASATPHLGATPASARGCWPALPATLRHIPALSLGALDERGMVPRSHTAEDTPDRVELAAVERVIQFGLLLIDEIDAHLAA